MRPPLAKKAPKISASSAFTRIGRRLQEIARDEPISSFAIRHLALLRKCLGGPWGRLARGAPRFTSRYTRPYLSLSLTITQRRDIFLFHHTLFIEKLKAASVKDAIAKDILLWSLEASGSIHSIRMTTDKLLHGEGDLVLYYYLDDDLIYDLAFNFAPGQVFHRGDSLVLLITRVQGRPKLFEKISFAKKACGDILPSFLLLAAIEGVADVFGVQHLYGVTGDNQLSSRWPGGSFDYDNFWNDQLGERAGDWYIAGAPLQRKPLQAVAPTHRRRAKRKRSFKEAVTSQVRQRLQGHLST